MLCLQNECSVPPHSNIVTSLYSCFWRFQKTQGKGKRRNLDQTALAQDLQFRILFKNYAKVIFNILLKFFFYNWNFENLKTFRKIMKTASQPIRRISRNNRKKKAVFLWQRGSAKYVIQFRKPRNPTSQENVFQENVMPAK